MASVGSESPPRKKLKQARLPFQVISSPRADGEKSSKGGMKRKLSESADDVQITKVVCSTVKESSKENATGDGLKSGMKAMLSSLLTSKIINTCTDLTDDDINIPAPIVSDNEDCVKDSAQDKKQVAILSQNALSKLSAWRKSPTNDENDESAEKGLEESPVKPNSGSKSSSPEKPAVNAANPICKSPSNEEHQSDDKGVVCDDVLATLPSNIQETTLREVGTNISCEDPDSSEHSNLSGSAKSELIETKENSEKGISVDNSSGKMSVVEVDLESESNENKKMSSPNRIFGLKDSPKTPKAVNVLEKTLKLTPKQLARQKEMLKKQEEREKMKQEKERKKQEEHDERKRLKQEKEDQKKKEREEKEEQKRKEKEEKEESKRKEREEKERKRQAEIDQKNEDKRKREESKKKAEEEEERKKAKVSAMFTSFFVHKGSKPIEKEAPSTPSQTCQNFMPFEVKADMRVAPCVRTYLDSNRSQTLTEILQSPEVVPLENLYLKQLRRGDIKAGRSHRTWLREETKDEDISVLEPDSEGVFVEQPKTEKMRAKLLQFDENQRPAYYGTWRKKSQKVTGRRPFAQDQVFDYDVDSADEWEEEEPGESLHGSDDEKEKESEDEYEVDNSVFVPHGYLSDDEGDVDADEDALCPEMQKAKLKILGEEFETQMKTKTSVLKPIVIILTAAMQSAKLSTSRYQKLADRRAVWREDEGPIDISRRCEASDNLGHSPHVNFLDGDSLTMSNSRGRKLKDLVDEAIPALITLVHGCNIRGSFLVNEFYEFLNRLNEGSEDVVADSAVLDEEEKTEKKWPKFPCASKACIARRIKEIAVYGPCTEEGPMKGKWCWIVSQSVRERYGLSDLKLPNRWKFILKRPRKEKAASTESSPSSASGITETGPTSGAVSEGSAKRSLITKFTKVMTDEEKQLHWEKMKSCSPVNKTPQSKPKLLKITAFTLQKPASSPVVEKPVIPTVAAQPQPQVKRRVPLLVSVPRGQDISSAVEAARQSNQSMLTSSPFASIKPLEQISAKVPETAPGTSEEKQPPVIDLD